MNMIRLENRRTRKQERALIQALLSTCAGDKIDAMDAAIKCNKQFGLYADWHEYSFVLDDMRARGQAEHAGIDRCGRTQYIIK